MKHSIAEGYNDQENSMRDKALNVLVVDDDKVVREFLTAQIQDLGHNLWVTEDGQKALAILHGHQHDIDVVLMDWAMPVMDGLTAIGRMKEDTQLRHIPVILLTGADKPEEMKRGMEAGVFYYLTKPVKKLVLGSVLDSAGRAGQRSKALAHELKQHRAGFELIDSCRFSFKTLDQAENLAVFVANCFPDPGRVLPGLGELLINAIEHGNLGIGYEDKSRMMKAGTWRADVEHLQKLPEHIEKSALATISRKDGGIYVVIEDQGNGFSWKKFMTVDPARAGDHCGRGIAQARAISFDKLTYNEKGNKAVAFVRSEEILKW